MGHDCVMYRGPLLFWAALLPVAASASGLDMKRYHQTGLTFLHIPKWVPVSSRRASRARGTVSRGATAARS